MNRIHFHSIDALRFFAFFKVYLLHIPIQGNFPIFSFLKSGGGIGVSFFFVLSGFLITYLLVLEKSVSTKINVKRFFVKRTLRIWPLFILMVLMAYLLPIEFKERIGFHMIGGGYDLDWRYSFTFMENYKMLIFDNFPKTTPLSVFWSLCTEEHFYIFWLISLFVLPVKHILKFLIFCFGISWLSRYVEPSIFANNNINSIDLFTNLDYFASGGILGYLVVRHYERLVGFIKGIRDEVKWSYVAAVVIVVVFQKQLLPNEVGTVFYVFRPTIIGILFTALISVFIPHDTSVKIKSKALSYLGVRSYGLYVYHIIFVHVVFQYFLDHEIRIDDWTTLSVFILITLVGSIVVSAISYKYFEMPFLRLRNSKKLDSLLNKKSSVAD